MPKITAKIEGVPALLRKLEGDPVHAKPWRDALARATKLAEEEAHKRAPVRRGKLQASVTSRLDATPMPRYGIVTAPAASPRGIRYGFILDAGRGRRKRHRGWFRGVIGLVQPRVNEILGAAAREIERRWQT